MLSPQDLEIIHHLRANSRVKLTELSQQLNLPVTTLYSKLKNYEKALIKKHTSLIDFTQLGYYKSIYLILKTKERNKGLKEFLTQQNCINSLFRINYDYDFLLECLFKNEKEVTNFLESLQENFNLEIQLLNVVEELKREDFIAQA